MPMQSQSLPELWVVANKMLEHIQALQEQLENRQYVGDNMQVKQDLEFVYHRCEAWIAKMQACGGQLSDGTIAYLKQFELDLVQSENDNFF